MNGPFNALSSLRIVNDGGCTPGKRQRVMILHGSNDTILGYYACEADARKAIAIFDRATDMHQLLTDMTGDVRRHGNISNFLIANANAFLDAIREASKS